MMKKSQTPKDAAHKVAKNIRRKTRQTYSAEEKIRIVLACLRMKPNMAAAHLKARNEAKHSTTNLTHACSSTVTF